MAISFFRSARRSAQIKRSSRNPQRRLRGELLEERLPFNGTGFEVDNVAQIGSSGLDGVCIDPGAVDSLAFKTHSGAVPLAVDPSDPDANVFVRTVARARDDGSNVGLVTCVEMTGLTRPDGGLSPGQEVFQMEFVGFVGDDDGDVPHRDARDRVLNVSARKRPGRGFAFLIDGNDDGTPDGLASQIGINAGIRFDASGGPTDVTMTVAIAGLLNIHPAVTDTSGVLDPQRGVLSPASFVTVHYADFSCTDSCPAQPPRVQAAGYQYRVDRDGTTTANSHDVPAGVFDVDPVGRTNAELRVAIMSTANYDATQLAAEDFEVQAFDQDGQFLGYVDITNTRIGDVDGDGNEDLGLALQVEGALPPGSLFSLLEKRDIVRPNQGITFIPVVE